MIDSNLLHAAMWAGLLSLDITGFGPLMVSQPLVAGPLFGWLMGQVRVGVILGGVMQLIWLDISPVGVGIPFDSAAATILAVFWASLQPDCPLSKLMLVLIVAVPFGYLFSAVDSYARRVHTLMARRLEGVPDAYLDRAIDLGIAAGLLWTWLRYVLLYALVMAGGDWIWKALAPIPLWVEQGLVLAASLFPIAGLGVALEFFLTDEPERRIPVLRAFKSKG